jgi:hypothetical protein
MKRFVVYFSFTLAVIFLQSCSSDSENIKKEGCIDKNTLRVVVFISESTLPAGKLNKDMISKEAVKIAEQRCNTIITNALAINKKQIQSASHVVSWKLVLVEKQNNGYMGIVDYTLCDEVASLLQCK